jgi:NADPH-dependent 2,4-dienoyl-CoA reductase/sulfur reductase-like enzyme
MRFDPRPSDRRFAGMAAIAAYAIILMVGCAGAQPKADRLAELYRGMGVTTQTIHKETKVGDVKTVEDTTIKTTESPAKLLIQSGIDIAKKGATP